MRKKKKYAIAISVLIGISILLTACGENTGGNSSDTGSIFDRLFSGDAGTETSEININTGTNNTVEDDAWSGEMLTYNSRFGNISINLPAKQWSKKESDVNETDDVDTFEAATNNEERAVNAMVVSNSSTATSYEEIDAAVNAMYGDSLLDTTDQILDGRLFDCWHIKGQEHNVISIYCCTKNNYIITIMIAGSSVDENRELADKMYSDSLTK